MKKLTLTEATMKALQKEDKATDSELILYMKSYREALEYLDSLYDSINGYMVSSLSDTYCNAEDIFTDKLLDERNRIEKLLGRVENDLTSKNSKRQKK